MPENDQKERILTGTTVEDNDAVLLEEARADLVTYVRTTKGLTVVPIQFDVDALSKLASVPVIDQTDAVTPPVETKVIDISNLSHDESKAALSILKLRAKKLSKKAA